MVHVVGSDPGTSSLDLLLLEDGAVIDRRSLQPGELASDRALILRLFTTKERWPGLFASCGERSQGDYRSRVMNVRGIGKNRNAAAYNRQRIVEIPRSPV